MGGMMGIVNMLGAILYLFVMQPIRRAWSARESFFTWRRILIAGGLGSPLSAMLFVDEKIDYSDAHPILFTFVIVLFGIAAGAGYSHIMRLQPGKRGRFARIAAESLVMAAGYCCSVVLIGLPFFLWIAPDPELNPLWLYLPVGGLVLGLMMGVLNIIGAALYIFVAQCLVHRWRKRKEN